MSQSATVAAHAGHPAPSTPFGVTNGKYGIWMFLMQDCMGFVGFFAAYTALRVFSAKWPDPPHELGIWLTSAMTFVLICSSVTMVFAHDACERNDQFGMKWWLFLTMVGGLVFLGGQVWEYNHLLNLGYTHPFDRSWGLPRSHNFWVSFYALTSFHGLHVLGGVIYLFVMWIGAMRGKFGPHNHTRLEICGLYWHFVDLVWIVLFTFVYLLPSTSPYTAHLHG